MDSRIGLDYIVENAEYTTKLGAGKSLFELPEIHYDPYQSVKWVPEIFFLEKRIIIASIKWFAEVFFHQLTI